MVKYPYCSFMLTIRFHPLAWGLRFRNHRLTKTAKENGNDYGFMRVGPFTFSFSRML